MSKRQYTKSPDLRHAKVGIGGCFGECFGEAQRGIVIQKRGGSGNDSIEGGAARHPANGEGAKRAGTQGISGSGKRIINFRLSACRTVYSLPLPV